MHAQQTAVYDNPLAIYKNALELFNKQKFSAAQDGFIKTINLIGNNQTEMRSNSEYYVGLCAIELFNADAQNLMMDFITANPENNKIDNSYFQLAKYEFRNKNYQGALNKFNEVDIYKLSESEAAEYNFKKGYCYFHLNDFDNAKKCFYEVKDKDSKYTSYANYYYAHLAYVDKNYETALESFKKIINDENYGKIAPYYITQIYFLQGKYEEVITYAPPLIDSASVKRVAEIAKMIGESYFKTGKFAEAIPYLDMYFAKTTIPITREDEYQLGYAYYKVGNFDKSIEVFKKINTSSNDSLTQIIYYNLGDCYLQTNQKQYAIGAFQEAYKLKFDPEIAENSLFNFGKLCYETSNNPYNKAIVAFQIFVKQFPDSKNINEAYEYLSNIFLSTKNYKDALTYIESIKQRDLKINTIYQKICFFRGVELFNDGKYEESFTLFNKSLQNRHDVYITAQTMFWKGEIFYRTEHIDSALNCYQTFQKLPGAFEQPIYNLSNYNIGYCYFKLKKYADALSSFRKFDANAKSEKTDVLCDAFLRTGDCYFMGKDYNAAIEYFNKAISSGKVNPDYALYMKALSFGALGKFESKVSALNELITKYKESVYTDDALYEMANTYQEALNQPIKAIDYYNSLITNYPLSSYVCQAMLKTGLIYYNQKNDEKALTILKEVVSKYPSTPESKEALLSIKNVYVSMGNSEEFFNYAKQISFSNISSDEQDSITYIAVENRYMDNDCANAVIGFASYINKFPNGAFVLDANFYKAECDYNSGKLTDALVGYEYVIGKPKSKYTEKSLLTAATITFKDSNYSKAAEYYSKLEYNADDKNNITIARSGLMHSYYALKEYNKAVESAENLLKIDKLDNRLKADAYMIIGRSALNTDSTSKAIAAFGLVIKLTKSEIAAEAKYNLALIQYNLGNYAVSEKLCIENSEMPYEYWIAKSFILLGDNYVKTNNLFQAKHTYQSIIDNYEGADLVKIAVDKLKVITDAEKAEEQKKQEELIKQKESEQPQNEINIDNK